MEKDFYLKEAQKLVIKYETDTEKYISAQQQLITQQEKVRELRELLLEKSQKCEALKSELKWGSQQPSRKLLVPMTQSIVKDNPRDCRLSTTLQDRRIEESVWRK